MFWQLRNLSEEMQGSMACLWSFPDLTLGVEGLLRENLHCPLRIVLLVMRGKRGNVEYGERSKAGNTANIIAAEPLVFSVVIWNYVHLGFKASHGVTLEKKIKKVKLELLLVPTSSSPFPFPLLSNSDCI